MRKCLLVIGLGLVTLSCAQRNIVRETAQPLVQKQKIAKSEYFKKTNPGIEKKCGLEFYKKNIGDVSKNDNTMSYGSIVSAKPLGYKVVKDHFPAVSQDFRQKFVIVHYTALNNEKSIMVLTERGVSAHYLVNDMHDSEIYQLVDENKRAYHAGRSSWRKHKNFNDNSIGIEIVNSGYTVDEDGQRIFSPFPKMQVNKVAALLKDIVKRYGIKPTNILGHSDVAPTRKQDPGPEFPWEELYKKHNLGMWYNESDKMYFANKENPELFFDKQNQPSFIYEVQSALHQFGYDINPTGAWDEENRKVVEAFQYHFRPKYYDGVVDIETWAILQALNKKYPSK